MEEALNIAMQTHGTGSFTRPIVLIIMVLVIVTIISAVRKQRKKSKLIPNRSSQRNRRGTNGLGRRRQGLSAGFLAGISGIAWDFCLLLH